MKSSRTAAGDQVLNDFYDDQTNFHSQVKDFLAEMDDFTDDLSDREAKSINEFLIPFRALLDNPFTHDGWDDFSQPEKVSHLLGQFSNLGKTTATTMDSYAYLLSNFKEFKEKIKKIAGKNSDLLPLLDKMQKTASTNLAQYTELANDFVAATIPDRNVNLLTHDDVEVAYSRAKMEHAQSDMPMQVQRKLDMAVKLNKARNKGSLTKDAVIDEIKKFKKKRQSGFKLPANQKKAVQEVAICNLILGILDEPRTTAVEKSQKLQALLNGSYPTGDDMKPTRDAMRALREQQIDGKVVPLLKIIETHIEPFLLQERVKLAASKANSSSHDIRSPGDITLSSSSDSPSPDSPVVADEISLAIDEQGSTSFAAESPSQPLSGDEVKRAALALAKGDVEEAEEVIAKEVSPEEKEEIASIRFQEAEKNPN